MVKWPEMVWLNGGVARSAEECRVVLGRGGADIGELLNFSTTIAKPLK